MAQHRFKHILPSPWVFPSEFLSGFSATRPDLTWTSSASQCIAPRVERRHRFLIGLTLEWQPVTGWSVWCTCRWASSWANAMISTDKFERHEWWEAKRSSLDLFSLFVFSKFSIVFLFFGINIILLHLVSFTSLVCEWCWYAKRLKVNCRLSF